MASIHVGDRGTVLTVTVQDETGAALPLPGATVDLTFQRPNLTTITVPGVVVGDGQGGQVTYTTQAGGDVFDAPGRWALQLLIAFTADQRWRTTNAHIDVEKNL